MGTVAEQLFLTDGRITGTKDGLLFNRFTYRGAPGRLSSGIAERRDGLIKGAVQNFLVEWGYNRNSPAVQLRVACQNSPSVIIQATGIWSKIPT
jgi:hypothetical protein